MAHASPSQPDRPADRSPDGPRVTYCRICPGICGLLVDVVDNRVVRVRGDADNVLTRGYTCAKGRRIGDFHAAPDRVRQSLARDSAGRLVPTSTAAAIDQIAERISSLTETYGPDSVAMITGTQAAMSSLTGPFARAWFATLGSRSLFTPQTIDQSAKWVADGRLGAWAGGRQRFDESDVWMLVGTNPLISMQGGDITGFPVHNPYQRLQAERRRGLTLIVVDPRRTETAAQADLHLQLIPGTDSVLFAGLLRILLAEGYDDSDFCARWVDGLDDLRAAVAPFTPEAVATACGLSADDVVAAGRMFGRAARGMATTGTGPDMAPHANLNEHLVQCLNVVCGRYPRAGDRQAVAGVLGAGRPRPAQAVAPTRMWERGPRDRFGYGQMYGESPIVTLPDRILTTGPDRIRALVVVGANPAAAIPDQARTVEALGALDLLVTVDPFMSHTARLADYVIAAVMQLERPDTTRAYEALIDVPFAQYTAPVLDPPPDSVEDWEFFLRLSWAMGRSLSVAGVVYPPEEAVPAVDDVLASYTRRARVPLAEVRRHPHGEVYDVDTPIVGPAEPDAAARFTVLPADVAAELASVRPALGTRPAEEFRLVVRRARETLNSMGPALPGLPRHRYNPCFIHPADLADLGLVDGELATVASASGRLTVVLEADPTLRRQVVAMTHAFGGLPADEDPLEDGVNTGRLISLDTELESISAMPRMTAIPVRIEAAVPAGAPLAVSVL